MRLPSWLAQHLAALRTLVVLTVVLGLAYPLLMVAVARIPGLAGPADGSLVDKDGKTVGSALIGQSFVDGQGNPLKQYFQSRPSAAGDGYDPTSTSASNLGPENVVDTLPDPNAADDAGKAGKPGLLTQVCARSKAVGELEGVDGARPYCTAGGVGAVLAVWPDHAVSLNEACPAAPFVSTYEGRPVACAEPGADYSTGIVTAVRGNAPATPAVPADAVTASGSGLDPHISVAYAMLQIPRVARERGLSPDAVRKLVDEHTDGRTFGFLGEPAVNVLELNVALDRS
ncbi:potassium-transporting ATPase subunit C [Dactylosporangium matsuzakiense]|uniref:Potassium-transporting ATPase KdpC subunit n=1 Tax=Dactylosporangium matsuzakiense TaxID=53360 RepID=A0A9W6NIV0_9ACTN|nr:potassium-transporting ATPase subunit C [Dactylosporangium matsuzakiense]GLK99229.1 potassium-transporting ATPase KdpC subunit [Dactylosporangium matsuzakiense]